jgi:hypothetical protein
MPVIPDTQEAEVGGSELEISPGKGNSETVSKKKGGSGAQVVECLPDMCKVLDSISTTIKNKQTKIKVEQKVRDGQE